MESIDIVKLVKKISDRWYILTALLIIGGLSGFLISTLTPPIFESEAIFSVTIDYTQTGSLTDIQEDQAMRGVGSVILSDQVITSTLSQLKNDKDLELNRPDFSANSFLDREEFRWTLRYRSPDPKIADLVIKTWAENADLIIQDGLTHSLASSSLLDTLNDLKTCLQRSSKIDEQEFCGNNDLDKLMNSISKISGQIQKEKVASLGLFNSLSVSLVNNGENTLEEVLGQRNFLVFSGALIGFFMGIIAIAFKALRSTSI